MLIRNLRTATKLARCVSGCIQQSTNGSSGARHSYQLNGIIERFRDGMIAIETES